MVSGPDPWAAPPGQCHPHIILTMPQRTLGVLYLQLHNAFACATDRPYLEHTDPSGTPPLFQLTLRQPAGTEIRYLRLELLRKPRFGL